MNAKTQVRVEHAAIVVLSMIAIVLGLALRYALLSTPETRPSAPASPVSAAARSAPTPAPQTNTSVLVVDLSERVAQWDKERADFADTSQSFFNSPKSAIHVHALGFGQTTPLHIHRKSDEVTVVVTGRPHVTHVYGDHGRIERAERDAEAGTLIHSPAFCGHEWGNGAPDHVQANLVFSTPAFDGNLYVKPDDPRLARGPAPFVFRPDEARAAFVRSGEPLQLVALEGLGDRVAALFVRQRHPLTAAANPMLLYIVSGSGTLHAEQTHPIRAGSLVMVPPKIEVAIEPSAGDVLALYVLRPS